MLKVFRQWRIFTLIALFFMGYFGHMVATWYMGVQDPNNSQGAFASAVVLAVLGALKMWVETHAAPDPTDDNNESS